MGRTSAKAAAAAAAAAPSSHKQKQKQQTGCCSHGSDCNEANHSHGHSHGHSHASPAAAAASSSAGGAASSASVPYRCAVSKSMGRSLVATRAIKAGEMILREWPAAMLHFRHNARQVLACAACGRSAKAGAQTCGAMMRLGLRSCMLSAAAAASRSSHVAPVLPMLLLQIRGHADGPDERADARERCRRVHVSARAGRGGLRAVPAGAMHPRRDRLRRSILLRGAPGAVVEARTPSALRRRAGRF